MPEIGATLREARMRARIDVSEIEALTKIRAKYLRALENEEWGLVPGATFVKSFLRTYGDALGLDGKALVEEYRLHHERPSEGAFEPIASAPQRRRRAGGPSAPSRAYTVAISAIGLVIIVLVVLLIAGGGSTSHSSTASASSHHSASRSSHHAVTRQAAGASSGSASPTVALSLTARSLVYVCLIGDHGRRLIPGSELQPGESSRTYHARRFKLTLGNSGVVMYVDGRARSVAPSSQAIGYSITKARGRQPLSAAELPTCA